MEQKERIKKRITILLLVILVILSYLTVKTMYANKMIMNSPKPEMGPKRIKIGFSLGTLKEERWVRDRDILMAKVKELGADIVVQNANNDDQDQLKQVKYLLDQKISVLIIVPNDLEKASDAVELAQKQGVKVISYDRLVMKSNVDLYISFDNEKVGELMAEYLVEKLPRGGNVLIINGAKSDHNTKLIKNGYDRVLQPYIREGKIKIINEEWAPNWMKEYAYKVTDVILQEKERLDAVIAANDGLADGVIGALSEQRLAGKVPVTGQDADLTACQRIVEGIQLMTVYKPIEKLAGATAELALKLAKEERPDTANTIFDGRYEVPFYVLEPVAVDKSNIDTTVIKDGFHLQNQVYRNRN